MIIFLEYLYLLYIYIYSVFLKKEKKKQTHALTHASNKKQNQRIAWHAAQSLWSKRKPTPNPFLFFFLLISGPSVFIFSNIQLWPSEPVPADLFFAADPAIVPAPSCIRWWWTHQLLQHAPFDPSPLPLPASSLLNLADGFGN
jgi:hypothetical protein